MNVRVEESSLVGVNVFVEENSSVVDSEVDSSSLIEIVTDSELVSSIVSVVVTLKLELLLLLWGPVTDSELVTEFDAEKSWVSDADWARVDVGSDKVHVVERLCDGSIENVTDRDKVCSKEGVSLRTSENEVVSLRWCVSSERLALNVYVGTPDNEKVPVVLSVSVSNVRVSSPVWVSVSVSDNGSVVVTVLVIVSSFVNVVLPVVEFDNDSNPESVFVHSFDSLTVRSSVGEAVGSGLAERVPDSVKDLDKVSSRVSLREALTEYSCVQVYVLVDDKSCVMESDTESVLEPDSEAVDSSLGLNVSVSVRCSEGV